MLILTVIGVSYGVIMLFAGWLIARKEEPTACGMYMLNVCGHNIGNFVMPFIQAVFPGLGVTYLCMYDVGSAFINLGAAPASAGIVAASDTKVTVGSTLKKMFTTTVLDTYIVVFIMNIAQVTLPDPLLTIAQFFGSANSFLVFFMLGLLLELKVSPTEMHHVWKVIFSRLIISGVLMIVSWFLLPVPLLAKKILLLLLAGPAVSPATIFSPMIGYKGDAPAIINSITVLISIVIMSVLAMLLA